MIDLYKNLLGDLWLQLPQPDLSQIPWKLFTIDFTFFAEKQALIDVPFEYEKGITRVNFDRFYEEFPLYAQRYCFEHLRQFTPEYQWVISLLLFSQKKWVMMVDPDLHIRNLIEVVSDVRSEFLTIIIKSSSRATIHDTLLGSLEKRTRYVDIIIEKGAHLTFVIESKDSCESSTHLYYRFFIYDEASLVCYADFSEFKKALFFVNVYLCGPFAQAFLKGLYRLCNKQELLVITKQHHEATKTSSNIVVKGVVYDKARAGYYGTITIPAHAQRSEAFQENKNIFFSKSAYVFSQPNLEIKADNVRCKHASAIGAFDEEQLLYVQARAFTEEHAKNLLLEAFLADVTYSHKK